MKRRIALIATIALLLCITQGLSAQISFGGTPPSFNYSPSQLESLNTIHIALPDDMDNIMRAAQEDEEHWGYAPLVATAIPVSIDLAADGQWTTLGDGTRICRLQLRAEGAASLLLSYQAFTMPEGSSLYLYNKERSHLTGAYTAESNPKRKRFSTEAVTGDDILLEYVSRSDEMPRIVIDNVGYVFAEGMQKIGESGKCMVNVNCSPEGDDWQDEKKGVCKMLMYITEGMNGAGWYLCSGSLVNNTAQDLTPYLLSAYHCFDGSTEEDLERWQFIFNHESAGCEDDYPMNSHTLVGCYFRAYTPIVGGSDGLLLELFSEIPVNLDVLFNGWDRRVAAVPGIGVGIHHPKGDLKKITTFDEYFEGTWHVNNYPYSGADYGHWVYSAIETENGHGVTEGGSSGSPMFNSDKLIVGTLTGGDSDCNQLYGYSYYGKMWYHWDKYGNSPETQMKTWLDPLDLGVETLPGIAFNLSSPRVETDKALLAFSGIEHVGQVVGEKVIIITGHNLTENILIETDLPFELSTDKEGWGTAVALPPEGATVHIRYVPKQPGIYSESLTISGEEFRTKTIELYGESCAELTLAAKPRIGIIDESYSFTFKATGSEAPYLYSLTEGQLPQGLTLKSDGTLSGVPEELGTFSFILHITDKYGCSSSIETGLYVTCEIIDTFPYTIDFEGDSDQLCFEYDYLSGQLPWIFENGGGFGNVKKPSAAYEGSANALLLGEDESGYTTRLITPLIDFSSFEKMPLMTFHHAQVAWYGIQDELRVYYRSSILGEWKRLAKYEEEIGDWTEENILLPEASAEYSIAFEGKALFGHGVVLDAIRFSESDVMDIGTITDGAGAIRYNNPVRDELRLALPHDVNRVSIHGIAGNRVYSAAVNPLAGELTIPTDHWSNGVYILTVANSSTRVSYKLIKY